MNTAPRLFIDVPLGCGIDVAVAPSQAHYLGTVMRRRPGDVVRVFNGRDGEWVADIVALGRDRATLRPRALTRIQAPEPDLWLVFALLKRDATDLVVQKATELGVSALLPVLTERTNAGRTNEARLTAIAMEAAEQSERLTVPRIFSASRLDALIASWPPERRLYAAIERSDAAWPPRAQGASVQGPSALLVGPEGGFTARELDGLGSHPFVAPVSLGPRVLRAETACLVGLALLQAPGCG
jgi:16S rRNA (uracil1498-N3)-methyltransferase